MSGWDKPEAVREKILEALLLGLPAARHSQYRVFFQQVIETDREPANLKLSLPASRRVIASVDCDDTQSLADALVAFIHDARTRLPHTIWAYRDLPDPEAEWLSDVSARFVHDWRAEHG